MSKQRELLLAHAAAADKIAALHEEWAALDTASGHKDRASFNERQAKAFKESAMVYRAHAAQTQDDE